jgi:hypothetical protein
MDDGWWKVEINGQAGKLLILDAAITLKKQSSNGSDKAKKKPVARQKSKKDEEPSPRPDSPQLNSSGAAPVPAIQTTTADGIGVNHVASAPSLISPRSSQRGLLASASTNSVPSTSSISPSGSSDNIPAPATTESLDDNAAKRPNFAKRASLVRPCSSQYRKFAPFVGSNAFVVFLTFVGRLWNL